MNSSKVGDSRAGDERREPSTEYQRHAIPPILIDCAAAAGLVATKTSCNKEPGDKKRSSDNVQYK
jgi:hypothetical protein